MTKAAWDEVVRYVAANAQHNKKGWRLADLSPADVLAYAGLEYQELRDAPDDLYEMADLMGCLIHYCQRKGWSAKDVEDALMEKLAMRFNV